MKRSILFITRRYPPSIGGIETHCYQLCTRLKKQNPVILIALSKRSILHLGWFLPYAFFLSLFHIVLGRVGVIYLADGVVGSLAPLFRLVTKLRIVITIYGMEMTYGNPIARSLMANGVNTADAVAVISKNTRETTIAMSVPPEKISLIYVGIQPLEIPKAECDSLQKEFEQKHGITFGKDRVLLNFGRLVPRKGVAAFLEKGIPLLDPDIKLIIGGGGPDFNKITTIRERDNLEDRVTILHRPSDETIAMLRQKADLFIFPNIPFANDIEGFGMTQLESMYSGTPVVAFAVDALVESVREGGYLIEPNDYEAFTNQIHTYFAMSQLDREAKIAEAKSYVRREYSWEHNATQYQALFSGDR